MAIAANLTIPKVFWDVSSARASEVAFRQKRLGIWNEITWAAYREAAADLAAGLVGLGLRPGDIVAIIAGANQEALFFDMGVQLAGGVPAALYAGPTDEDILRSLRQTAARIVYVDAVTPALAALPRPAGGPLTIVSRHKAAETGLACGVVLHGASLARDGRALRAASPGVVEQQLASRKGADAAVISFTPGTTGASKAVVLSHDNLLAGAALQTGEHAAGDERLLVQPLAHVSDRLFFIVAPLLAGGVTNIAEADATFLNDLRELSPTSMSGSPRFWRRLKHEIGRVAQAAYRHERWAVDTALSQSSDGRSAPQGGRSGTPATWSPKGLVLRRVRAQFGLGRVRRAISVGATPPGLTRWYRALGVDLRARWSPVELCGAGLEDGEAPAAAARASPAPGWTFRVEASGEIFAKGASVSTRRLADDGGTISFDVDGWCPTGDVGDILEAGGLRVHGRVGKLPEAFADRELEHLLQASDAVAAVRVAQNPGEPPFAVIAVDDCGLELISARRPATTGARTARAIVSEEIDALNAKLSPARRIGGFRLVQDAVTPVGTLRERSLPEDARRARPNSDETHETRHGSARDHAGAAASG